MLAIKDSMQASTDAVSEGEAAIGDASGQIGVIADQVGSVSNRMMEISGILSQQKGASTEIATSIDDVADTAAESDALVQQVSKSMHESTTRLLDNAKDMFDADSDIALCYMAKIDHVLFKQRVVDSCMGGASWASRDVPDHHNCRLGKWYDSLTRAEVKSNPAFAALVEPHKRVHESAKAALDAAVANETDAMTEHLHALDQASIDVLQGLDALSQHIIELEAKTAA